MFTYVLPVLLAALGLNAVIARTALRERGLYTRTIILITASLFISMVPLGRLSLSQLLLSVNPVFSIGSISLIGIVLIGDLTGKKILGEIDLLLLSVWNILISLCLYLSYLNFIGADIYYAGYGSALPFAVTAAVTIVLIVFRSNVAWVFISYIAAYVLRLLPSENFFDYVTDVPLFITSLVILISYIVKSTVRWREMRH